MGTLISAFEQSKDKPQSSQQQARVPMVAENLCDMSMLGLGGGGPRL